MKKLVLTAAVFAAITGMAQTASAAPWKCELSANVAGFDSVIFIARITKLEGPGTINCRRFTGLGPDGQPTFQVAPPRRVGVRMAGGGLAAGFVGPTPTIGCLQIKTETNAPLTAMDHLNLAPESGFQGGRNQGSAGVATAYNRGRAISNGTYVKAQCDVSAGGSLNIAVGYGIDIVPLSSLAPVPRRSIAPVAGPRVVVPRRPAPIRGDVDVESGPAVDPAPPVARTAPAARPAPAADVPPPPLPPGVTPDAPTAAR